MKYYKKKYIVHPGEVRSKDGDRHFIGFYRLCGLYKVNPKECLNADVPSDMLGHNTNGLVDLYPSWSGHYSL